MLLGICLWSCRVLAGVDTRQDRGNLQECCQAQFSKVHMSRASPDMPHCAEPTPQGEQLLDPFHLCGRVKRLRDKPVQSFAGSDTFLRIAQAEKEGLIEVRIDVSPVSGFSYPTLVDQRDTSLYVQAQHVGYT